MTFPGANRQLNSKGIQKQRCFEAALQTLGPNRGQLDRASVKGAGAAMRRLQAKEQQRAQRFAIKAELRYRKVGEGEWHQGRMVNISKSGVLFETEHSTWPHTTIEMRFTLGAGISETWAAQVVCYGVIVRALTEPGNPRVRALAVKITKFHLVRPSQAVMAGRRSRI
jgi:hypothetical protein